MMNINRKNVFSEALNFIFKMKEPSDFLSFLFEQSYYYSNNIILYAFLAGNSTLCPQT